MENKIVNLQINDNLAETEKAVGSLKSQLRAAQNEVTTLADKFGATSKEAVEAAKKAGELKDKIGDAKALTDAFNPDAKFKSLSASLTGVAGGFSVVTGAMGAFGANTKDVEESLLKVQSAMAMASGLQAVGESIDSFKQLGAVVKSYSIVQKAITAGQWLWNIAMTANPLGAIIVAITAVIAAGYALIKFFGDVAVTSKAAMMGIRENTKALEDSERITKKHNDALKDSADYQYNMAKASGASSEELRKLSLKQINADVSLKDLNRTIAQNTYYRELNSLATLKASGATEEAIKMQDALVKKSLENFSNENKALTESLHNKKLLIQKNNVEIQQEHTNHNKKINEDANRNAEEAEKERVAKILESRKKDLVSVGEDLSPAAKASNATLQIISANQIAETLLSEDHSKARVKLSEAEAAAKTALFQKTSDTLSKGADLLGRNTAAGKSMAVAAALINTYQGITAELATKTVTPFEIGLKIANVAVIAATGFKAVKDIIAVPVPRGGGGSGGGSAPSAAAPQFNVVGASGQNQIAGAIGNRESQPVQAYVVAGAVTTGQALNRNIISNASMG